MRNFWTGGQYSVFRILFGTYLFVHFAHLLPWAAEVFSHQGMIQDPYASPLFNVIPNILSLDDSGLTVSILVASGVVTACFFALGIKDKLAAGWMLYVLICLFARNPLISNPALPSVGWMLLLHLFIPSNPFGSWSAKNDLQLGKAWFMPRHIYYASVVILALTYSYSGYTKLLSPSWVAGDTIAYVLQNPLARHHFLNDFLLSSPPIVLKCLTWFILYIELVYAPLTLVRGFHKWLWCGMLLVQFGFLFLLNFPDLTVAMILMHLFTFNPEWVKSQKTAGKETVFFDGGCGFCHGYIKFLLAEDKHAQFRFSPLNGDHFQNTIDEKIRETLPTTLLVVTDEGSLLMKSDAVIHSLSRLGGLWGVIGLALTLIPKLMRDKGYDLVGSVRLKLMQKPNSVCPILDRSLSSRFI